MKLMRWIITFLIVVHSVVFPLEAFISVQFSLADSNGEPLNGYYNIDFDIFTVTENINSELNEPKWSESHRLYITEGEVTQVLGKDNELIYHLFKSPELFVRLYFKELNDYIYVQMSTVASSIYAEYSVYAREIEFTAPWMKISTPDHRVGIGVTTNLLYELTIRDTAQDDVGTMNANHVTADAMFSPDGYEIDLIDYRKLVDIDDYSMHPDDGDGVPYATINVIYVTNTLDVGVGIYATEDISSQLHVSGDFKIDYGKLYGDDTNVDLVGTANTNVSEGEGPQLIWESLKSFFRSGYASGDNMDIDGEFGDYVSSFGRDNMTGKNFSASFGSDNTTNAEGSIVFGKSNYIGVHPAYSGVLSGVANQIYDTINYDGNRGYSVILGGQSGYVKGGWTGVLSGFQNSLYGNYSSIVSGASNNFSAISNYSVIYGGESNVFDSSDYSSIGGYRSASNHDGVFIFSGVYNDNSDVTYIESIADSQFLVYAFNGVGIGTNETFGVIYSEDFPERLGTTLNLKEQSLRSVGDIIAIDDSLNYGYLIGDGRYITDIQSEWASNESNYYDLAEKILYLDGSYEKAAVIGIGFGSDTTTGYGNRPEAFFHLQDRGSGNYLNFNDFKAFKIESNDLLHYLYFHLEPINNVLEIDFSDTFEIQYESNKVLEIVSDNVEILNSLHVDYSGDDFSLDVLGTIDIDNQLKASGAVIAGMVTANVFSGSAAKLYDVQSHYLNDDLRKYLMRVYVNDVGHVGIGTVTSNAAQLLHIGDDTETPQIRFEDKMLSTKAYATFQSTSTSLQFVFNGYQTPDDVIFSYGSNSDGESDTKTLMQISATGNISIGETAPVSSALLSVDGNFNSTSFSGSGVLLTNEQLDVPQTSEVTFEKQLFMSDVSLLTPLYSTDGKCDLSTDVGTIFSLQDDYGYVIICACLGPGDLQVVVSKSSTVCEVPNSVLLQEENINNLNSYVKKAFEKSSYLSAVNASINIDNNIYLWLDGSNIDGDNNDSYEYSDPISTWVDLSSQDNDAIQNTSSFQPIFEPGNFVQFENNYMVSPVNISAGTMSDVTVIAVVRSTTSSPGGIWGQDSSNDRYLNNNVVSNGAESVANAISDNYNGSLFIVETFLSTSASSLYINGSFIDTFSATSSDGQTDLSIGSTNYANSMFTGSIAELMVINKELSASERGEINYYLAMKWGISDTVDSDDDGYSDSFEEIYFTNPIDSSNSIYVDFHNSVDDQISASLGLETVALTVTENLKLWLDASNININSNTGLKSGDTISSWVDLSGNGYSVSGVNTPSFDADGFNSGYPAVSFDNSDGDYFRTYNKGDAILGGQAEFTIFILAEFSNTSGMEYNVLAINDMDSSSGYSTSGFALKTNSNGYPEGGIGQNGYSAYSSTDVDVHSEAPVILEYSKETGSTAIEIKVNNQTYSYSENTLFSKIVSDADSGGLVSSDISIGSFGAIEAYPLDGKIAEILIFDRKLSDQEKFKVNYYLSKKWNLETVFDSDGDGYTDDVEEYFNNGEGSVVSSPIDETQYPITDFSERVDSLIGYASGLDEDNLQLWLSSQSIDGVYNYSLADGALSTWSDLSNSGNDLTQSYSTYQPYFDSNSQYVSFDGINDNMTISDTSALRFTGTQAYSFIAVYRPHTYQNSMIMSRYDQGNKGEYFLSLLTDGRVRNLREVSPYGLISLSEYVPNNTMISTVTFDGDTLSHYLNGSLEVSGSFGSVASNTLTFTVGAGWIEGGLSYLFDGEILEIIFTNDLLTSEELTEIHYYLSKNWGLEAIVDSDDDGYTDAEELYYGTSPHDSLDTVTVDFSAELDNYLGVSTYQLDSVTQNMVLWLAADQINPATDNIYLEDASISRWLDISGSGHNVIQLSTTNQPVLDTLTFDNTTTRNVLIFDGVDDYLDGGDILDVGTSAGWTVVVVGETLDNGDYSFLSKSMYAGVANRYSMLHMSNYGVYGLWHDALLDETINSSSLSSSGIMMMEIDRSTQRHRLYYNGSFIEETAIGNDSSYDMDSSYYFFVGAYNDNVDGTNPLSSVYLNGNIYEILIFDVVLSSEQHFELNRYLSEKWQLSDDHDLDLDADGYLATEDSNDLDNSDVIRVDFSDTIGSSGAVESNLLLWLDSRNINGNSNTGILDNESISRWLDLSGNGHVARQMDTSYQPIFNATDQLITFTNDKMIVPVNVNSEIVEDVTIIALYKINSGAVWGNYLQSNNAPRQLTSTGIASGASVTINELSVGTGDFILLDAYLTTNNSNVLMDGLLVHEFIGTNVDGLNSLSIGANAFDSTDTLIGSIAEFIVVSGNISTEDREKINAYLASKWVIDIDSDMDGFLDSEENLFGSDPASSNSVIKFDLSTIVETELSYTVGQSALDTVESNIQLWLDASNINANGNIDSSGAEISDIGIARWLDLSGNSNNALQSSEANQPIVNASQLNGLSTMTFDGVNDYLSGNYATAFDNDDITIFLVKKNPAQESTFYSTDIDDGYNYLDITNWATNTYTYFNDAASGNGYFVTAASMGENIFEIYTVRFDSTENSQASYDNGVYVTDQTLHDKQANNIDIATKQLSNYLIGKRPGSDTRLNGEIAELIVFDQSLDTSEIMTIHAYLSKKWGLESIVDSDADGYSDAVEEDFGSSVTDASDFPGYDFSNSVDEQIGEASDLDTIEANLSLWLDASNIDAASNATLSDSDAISEWKDLSGNGNDASSDEGSSILSQNNGKSVIRFNNSSMMVNNSAELQFGKDFTIIYVLMDYSDGTTLSKIKDGSYKQFSIFREADSNVYGFHYEQNANNRYFSWENSAVTSIQSFNFLNQSVSSTSLEVQINGASVTVGSTGSGAFAEVTDLGRNLYIGKMGGTYPDPANLQGDFAEILIFNKSLTDEELIKINYYLSTKWGLESIVDSDGDGYTDAVELDANRSPIDNLNYPPPNLTDIVEAQITQNISISSSSIDTVTPNLVLWLDASNSDGAENQLNSPGTSVSSWQDLSGNDSNAIQSDSDRQPNLDGESNMIDFDGVNDRFELPDGTIPAGNSNYTIIVLSKFNEPNNDWYSLIESGSMGTDSNDSNALAINKTANYGTMTNFIANYWWGDDLNTSNDSIQYEEAVITSFMYNGSQRDSFINGVLNVSDSVSNRNSTTVDNFIGSKRSDSYALDANIAEILIFDKVLSDQQRYEINYYLSKKWGLEDIIDSDGDGSVDALEELFETSPVDSSILPVNDLSDSIVDQIGSTMVTENNLKLWVDASNIDTYKNYTISNDSAISSWKDLSGQNNHGDGSGTEAVYKEITTDSIVRDVLEFDGFDEYDIGANITSGKSYTIFIVEQRDELATYSYFFGQLGGEDLNNRLHIGYLNSGAPVIKMGHNTNDLDINLSDDAFSEYSSLIQDINVLAFRFTANGNPSHEMIINGINDIYGDDSDNLNGNNSDYNLLTKKYDGTLADSSNNIIGRASDSERYKGKIMELIVFDTALSDEEVYEINYYLSKKWTLEDVVDSDGDGLKDDNDSFPLIPLPDFSTSVDTVIGSISNLNLIEDDLYVWLDASNVDGQSNASYTNGDDVTVWYDLSGNGNNVSNTGTGNTPLYNNQLITFNGQYFSGTLTESLSGAQTYIVVLKNRSTDVISGVIANNGYAGIYANQTTSYILDGAGSSEANSSNTNKAEDNLTIIMGNYTQSNTQDSFIYENGRLIENFTGTGVVIYEANNIQVGGRTWGGLSSRIFIGDIAEIIVFNKAISDDERTKVNYYLSKKWGLESIVDSDSDGLIDADDGDPLNPLKVDLSDTVDPLLGEASGLDTIESNLTLWLDASNIDFESNGTLSDGDAISEWKDLSGNAYHLSQSVVLNQPILTNQSIVFDGSKYIATSLGYGFSDLNGTDRTIIALIKQTEVADNIYLGSTFFTSRGHNSELNGITLSINDSQSLIVSNREDTLTVSSTDTIPLNEYHIFTFKEDNDSQQLFLDGFEYYSDSSTNWDISDNDQITLGQEIHGSSEYVFKGEIKEVLVFDTKISDQDLFIINYYLSKKWGLETTVDSDGDTILDDSDSFPLDNTQQ